MSDIKQKCRDLDEGESGQLDVLTKKMQPVEAQFNLLLFQLKKKYCSNIEDKLSNEERERLEQLSLDKNIAISEANLFIVSVRERCCAPYHAKLHGFQWIDPLTKKFLSEGGE